jgi:hypothetical protein
LWALDNAQLKQISKYREYKEGIDGYGIRERFAVGFSWGFLRNSNQRTLRALAPLLNSHLDMNAAVYHLPANYYNVSHTVDDFILWSNPVKYVSLPIHQTRPC